MARKGSTSQRGYGWKHQQIRRKWKRIVAAAGAVCARCGRLIHPFEPWDLGHDDLDRTLYTGPEHRACNRATAGKRGRARLRAW